MRRPTFGNGVVAALGLALLASLGGTALAAAFTSGVVVRLVIPALALVYVLYLISCSRDRVGRVTTVALWSALAVAAWLFAPNLASYLLLHAGAIWLVRALYFYSGIVPALMDLGLTALSGAASLWAMTHSGSVFLATWCFFLAQALFVAIPTTLTRPARRARPSAATAHRFDRARARAEAAIGQLFTR